MGCPDRLPVQGTAKFNMPQYCCVPRCTNSTGGHTFPTKPNLRQQWIVAIKRIDPLTKALWQPSQHDRVCRDHFTTDDYTTTLLGERGRLKAAAVPSVFSFKTASAISTPSALRRPGRSAKKEQKRKESELFVPEFGDEVTVAEDPSESVEDVSRVNLCSVSSQCHLLTSMNSRFSIHNFRHKPAAIKYYTGFDNFEHFQLILQVLGPAAYNLNFHCSVLPPEDQLFLTLMKLRQAKDDFELSLLFQISQSTVSHLINTWVNFMYFQLKEINIWPDKSVIQEHMPLNFGKQFKSTRVVLDATEVPTAKPGNVNAQSMTYSQYKGRNTLKTMIGCTPRGLVSYIGDSYGGSTSDRQLIEHSPLYTSDMFDKGDSIMADRGIMVQDLFAAKDVFVNTPTMLQGKSQLEPEKVVKDRRVASKRIHVERVIGLGKTFKILKKELPSEKRALGSRIMYICFILSNFRRSIVNKLA